MKLSSESRATFTSERLARAAKYAERTLKPTSSAVARSLLTLDSSWARAARQRLGAAPKSQRSCEAEMLPEKKL